MFDLNPHRKQKDIQNQAQENLRAEEQSHKHLDFHNFINTHIQQNKVDTRLNLYHLYSDWTKVYVQESKNLKLEAFQLVAAKKKVLLKVWDRIN